MADNYQLLHSNISFFDLLNLYCSSNSACLGHSLRVRTLELGNKSLVDDWGVFN